MIPLSPDETYKKLSNQSVFTKMLYFTLSSVANFNDTLTVHYCSLKEVIKPRKEEEVELGRSFIFLVNAGLIKLQSEGVGHG